MALQSNIPTQTYVSWTGGIVQYKSDFYSIQNSYTNKKYIYWELSNPYIFFSTNERLAEVGERYLVCINDNGLVREVPLTEINIGWDGNNEDQIKASIEGLYEKDGFNNEKFISIEKNIDKISTTMGEVQEEQGKTSEKISSIEQQVGEIDLSVKETVKEFADNKEFTELRENLNKSIIELGSALGIFSSKMSEYYKDKTISREENIEISAQLDIVNLKEANVILYTDKVLVMLQANNQTDKYNKLNSVKTQFIDVMNNLEIIINTSMSDNIILLSEISLIINAFGNCTAKITLLKNTLDEMIFLGSGGSISEELARIGITTEGIRLSYSKLESTMKNNLSIEKADLQGQIEDILTKLESLKTVCNKSFEDGAINATEKDLINLRISELESEKDDIVAKYNKYYTDSNLSDAGKVSLKQDYDKYINKHNELKTKITEIISDSFVNDAEKNQADTVIVEYQTQLNIVHNRMCLSIDIIESSKFNAEIQKMKDGLQKEINDVNKRIDDLDLTIDDTFIDNIIDKTERENINQNLDTLLREKTDVDNQYRYWYNNVFLDGTLKTQYKTSYDLYISKYDALVKLMNDILTKTELVNDEDKANLSKANKELLTAIEKFVTDTEKVIDYVNQKAVEKAKSDLHKEIGDINTSVGDLSDYIDGTFKDNTFDKSEKESIKQNLNNLSREKADVDSQYEKLYSNANLDGTLKTQYKASHDDYVSKYNNLVLVINNIVNKVELINDNDRANLENANALLNGSIKAFIGKSNEVIDYINKKEVSKAKTELSGEIDDVQGSLKDLNDEINGAFKDGILDSIEISAIEEQLRLLEKEKLDLDGQFTEVYNNKDLI